MWCYSCVRVKDRGISLFDVRRKDFVSNTIGTGVSLQGATSKRDSMWHSPVFTFIRANRIPVNISKGSDMKYANMCVQTLCCVTLRSDVYGNDNRNRTMHARNSDSFKVNRGVMHQILKMLLLF
jgi:hypothetical protein